MNNKICDNIKLNKKALSLEIYNKLRLLGIKTSNQGAKLIYLVILTILSSNTDIFILENIYSSISKQLGNINVNQIRRSIQYAIDNRNIKKSKENFEKIFEFEYDEDIFRNKSIIEEFVRILKTHLIYQVRNDR